MRTIAIISQKGGAGKTTVAVHLAVAAAAHGKVSLIVDTDPQATASRVASSQMPAGHNHVVPGAATNSHVPDETFLAAQEEFEDKELADLTLAIGLINIYNRMAITFRRTPASLKALTAQA
jgi:cellulose biosynthesis protein BcsQ